MKIITLFICLLSTSVLAGDPIYRYDPEAKSEFVWNRADRLDPGKSTTILSIEGEGVIERIWMTTNGPEENREEAFRLLTLKIFWDGSETPAVEAPVCDFFNQPFGPQAVNNTVSNSDGDLATFCVYLPMPFRKGARVEVQNSTEKRTILWSEFCVIKKKIPSDALYLHTQFNTADLESGIEPVPVLREVHGKGRYLGTHISAVVPSVKQNWEWYTRNVNVRIDGDGESPGPQISFGALDDFVGSGWWNRESDRKPFEFPYCGRHYVSDTYDYTNRDTTLRVAFYRYFIPDPLWFHKRISVSLAPDNVAASWRILSYYYLDTPGRPGAGQEGPRKR